MPAALKDPAVLDLAARVACTIDPDSAFPTFFSGGVRLYLRDGRTLFRHVRVNSGAGERALDADGMSRTFLASVTLVLPRDQAERIRDAVLTLEEHTAAHLASLLRSEEAGQECAAQADVRASRCARLRRVAPQHEECR